MPRQLVVPGTGGVIYSDAAGNQVGSIFDLLTKPDAPALLRCLYSQNPDDVDPQTNPLTASGHMTLAYEPFDHAIPAWQFFNYDWRLDIRSSAARLVTYLRNAASTGDRWRVVAHSQGGLVVLAAAQQLGADVAAQMLQSVCFVGTPFFGTENALDALLNGTLLGNKVPADVVRTWPSVYQMMPSWGIFDGTPNKQDLFLQGTWGAYGMLPAAGQALDLTKHVDPVMLKRGVAWQALRAANLFDAVHKLDYVRIIQGNNRDTSLFLPSFPSTNGAHTVQGDTLVPDQLTRDSLPEWIKDTATIRRLPAAEHMLLCSDPNVYELCL